MKSKTNVNTYTCMPQCLIFYLQDTPNTPKIQDVWWNVQIYGMAIEQHTF